jgi:integrase
LHERREVGPSPFTGRKGPLQKRQVQQLFGDYAKAADIKGRSVHALHYSMAVHLLEAGRGIEYVADHLGHKNMQNTRIYAQITHPLHEQVFRELEQHPKIVRLSSGDPGARSDRRVLKEPHGDWSRGRPGGERDG